MDYEKQAADFMTATNTTMSAKYLRTGKHFEDDKDERDIYEITLSSKGGVYKFNFGQSINASGEYVFLDHFKNKLIKTLLFPKNRCFMSESEYKKIEQNRDGVEKKEVIVKNPNYSTPTAYDVLSCLTKHDPGTLEEFCDDYGYNVDSRKAERMYNAVKDEYLQLSGLFTDQELELMAEIQ